MKKLPTSVENFKELIKGNYYYVDKSLLIKDALELPGKIKLITRPRRFGKTLNIDMMLHFFSMDEEDNLFENLKIWNEKEIVKEHYHKYPVIYTTFKSVKGSTWEKTYDSLRTLISELAKDMEKYANNKHNKEYIEKIIKKQATQGEYSTFLRNISKMVYEKTGIPPIILIDEYDVPIESAYVNREKDPQYYDNMIDFMRAFLTSALKGSDTYFSFAILTGVYRIAKESIFSGLNNLAIYSVFQEGMDDKFGFTESEVNEMLNYYNLTNEDKEIIDTWYGNYKIGETYNLYNPWSVINYIANRIISKKPPKAHAQKYWVNTSENQIIIEQIKKNKALKKDLDALLERKEVMVRVDPSLSLREIERKKHGVWVLFASSGYLNSRWVDIGKYAFKIPNEEIMMFFKDTVLDWIEEKTEEDVRNLFEALEKMLTKGEYNEFKENLQMFLTNGLSFYDVAKDETERFYKGFLLGMLALAINGYSVESEMESGYGRLDVVIYPKDKSYGKYATIFEVKRKSSSKKLDELAKEALQQIRDRKYFAKMKSLGYKVIGFGIAFYGKKVKIESGNL